MLFRDSCLNKMIQKTFIVVLVVIQILTTVNGISETEVQKVGELCQKEVKASDNDLIAVMNITTPMTKIQGCLTNCLFKKFEIIDNGNKINSTAFLEIFADGSSEINAESEAMAELKKAMTGCVNKYSDKDKCIAAKNYIECISNKLIAGTS